MAEARGRAILNFTQPPALQTELKDAAHLSRWEYASILSEGPATRDTLNDLGEQGWELVSFLQGKDTGSILYVFKRQKTEPPAAPTATLLA